MAYEYKNLYSEEEIKDICQWMSEHKDALPKELRLDKAEMCHDVPKLVTHILNTIELQKQNPVYSRSIGYLFQVRALIEESNNKDEQSSHNG